MVNLKTIFKTATACFLILIAYIMYNILGFMQTDLVIPKLNDEICRRLDISGNGPEDISYFNDKYLITATSHMHEIWHFKKDQELVPSGEIYLIDSQTENVLKLTKSNYPANVKFHAHGIYVKNEELYVINHAYKFGGERIDVFKIDIEKLEAIYLKSFQFSDEYFGQLNDIVVLDDEEESFFVTTWSIFSHSAEGPDSLKNALNFILGGGLRLKYTYIYSCSFKSGECDQLENTKGIMNNGITIKHNYQGHIIFSSDSFGKIVTSYSLKKEKGAKRFKLIKENEYHFDHLLENLIYSIDDDAIYVSLVGRGNEYPKLTEFMDNNHRLPLSEEFTGHSGSAKLNLKTGEITYLNFTTKIITASSVIYKDKKLFYGSWCDKVITICDI